VSADPERAAREVMAGRPGRAARAWLGPITIAVVVLFALDTYLVESGALGSLDLPAARFVQRFPWGPLVYPMELINWLGGYRQMVFGLIVVGAVFVYERRAGWLMAIGGVSSLIDNVLKLSLQRRRPTAEVVHILTPASGFSYPSGHAVFFTWISFMLAEAISPRIASRYRPIPWLIAAGVVVVTCLARVWAGDHWPSDVLGGFLLAIGWSAFVLWLPERLLPLPSFVRGRSPGPGRGD
jgi:membrane-associated phospholipid phosphatase